MNRIILDYSELLTGEYFRRHQFMGNPIASYLGARGARVRNIWLNLDGVIFHNSLLENLLIVIDCARKQEHGIISLRITKLDAQGGVTARRKAMAFRRVIIDVENSDQTEVWNIQIPDIIWKEEIYYHAMARTNLHPDYMGAVEKNALLQYIEQRIPTEDELKVLDKATNS